MPKFITPVEITPTTDGTFQDVDITTHVGGDAGSIAFAMIQCENVHATLQRKHALRKNGSTDDRYMDLEDFGHTWHHIGCDGNDIFEAKLENGDIHLWLIGWWTTAEAAAITNGVDHTTPTTDVYEDIDITDDVVSGTAIAAMFQVTSVNTNDYGFRKNGSTDFRIEAIYNGDLHGAWMAVDANEIVEGRHDSSTTKFFLIGYALDNLTDFINGKAYATGTTGSYVDVDVSSDVPSGNTGAAIQFHSVGTEYSGAVRKNGSSFDQFRDVSQHSLFFVELDSSRIFEQKIENTNLDMWLWGYMDEPPSGSTTNQALVVTAVASVVLNKMTTHLRDFTVTGAAVASCTKAMVLNRALDATAVGSATIAAATVFLKAIDATGAAVATFSTTICRAVSMVAGTLATATLTRLNTFKVSLTAISTGGLAFMANEIDATLRKGRAGWSQLFTNKRGGEGGLFRFRR